MQPLHLSAMLHPYLNNATKMDLWNHMCVVLKTLKESSHVFRSVKMSYHQVYQTLFGSIEIKPSKLISHYRIYPPCELNFVSDNVIFVT